jgi:hypothetical protein
MSFYVNEIDVGANPLNNNLHLYRRFVRPEFILVYDSAGVIDTDLSAIKINYIWYYKDTNGDPIFPGPVEYYYLIKDVPGHANFTNRLTQLWDTPIDGSAPGLRNAIEAVLANTGGILPIGIENGHTLNL